MSIPGMTYTLKNFSLLSLFWLTDLLSAKLLYLLRRAYKIVDVQFVF